MAEKQRRKKWADKDMVMAMDVVRNEKIYSAAVKFSVPPRHYESKGM